MRGRFKREGTYVYLWLSHVDVWKKPTQYCKAIILQLKINFKKAPDKQNSSTRWLHCGILLNIQTIAYTDSSQNAPKNWRGRTFPKTFYEVTITLIPKPDKDTTKKKDNYRLISLMNIDAKILANWIQQKRSYTKAKLDSSESQGWFNICKSINVIHQSTRERTKTTWSRCRRSIQ